MKKCSNRITILPVSLIPSKIIFFLIAPTIILILAPFSYLFADLGLNESGRFAIPQLTELLLSERQVGLLRNSLYLAFSTSFFSAIIGVPLAFLIHRTDLLFRKFFLVLSVVPLMVPPYMQAIVWTKYLTPLTSFWFSANIYSIPGAVSVLLQF